MTQSSCSPLVPSVPLCSTGTVLHRSAQFQNEDRIKISPETVQVSAIHTKNITSKAQPHRITPRKSENPATGKLVKGLFPPDPSVALPCCQSEPPAARSCGNCRRPAADPGWRRLGQDPRHHQPHRLADRGKRRRRGLDPRRNLHQQSRLRNG